MKKKLPNFTEQELANLRVFQSDHEQAQRKLNRVEKNYVAYFDPGDEFGKQMHKFLRDDVETTKQIVLAYLQEVLRVKGAEKDKKYNVDLQTGKITDNA